MRIRSGILLLWAVLGVLTLRAQQPGSLDTNYVTVAGTDAAPILVVPASEGRVYVGGSFVNYGGTGRAGFVRLLSTGAVDTGFTMPKITVETPPVILNGQVLVPGSTNAGNVTAALPLSDGRVVVLGNFNRIGTAAVAGIVVLNTDGSVGTTSFGLTGVEPGSILAGPGGTFYVGGKGTLDGGRLPLLRFRPDGSRDAGFTPPTLAELGYQSANPYILRPGPGSTFYMVTAAAVGFTPASDIVRLTQTGALDGTFGVGGKANIPFSSLATFVSDPAGRLTFTGLASFRGAALTRKINRITLEGNLDGTYLVSADPGFTGRVIGVQADGKLLYSAQQIPINRLNADGTPDTGYANPLKVPVAQTFMSLLTFALAPDGSVYAGGSAFGANFTVLNGVFHIFGDPNSAPVVAVQPQSQTNTLGARTRFFVIAQGAAPLSYQWYRNGQIIPGANESSLILDPSTAGDGDKDYHCVVANSQGATPSAAARLTLWTAEPGTVYRESDSPAGADSSVQDLRWDAAGGLVAVGGFTKFHGTNRVRAARLVGEGRQVDPVFDTSVLSGPLGLFDHLLPLSSGKILVVGNQAITYGGVQHQGTLRINANGSLDTTFNPTGTGGDTSERFAEAADGRLYVGVSTWNGAQIPNSYARLTADGARDNSFTAGPTFLPGRALLVLPDGKILVGGRTNLSNSLEVSSGVIRLNTDGTQDATFYRGPLPRFSSPSVTALLRQPDGRILVAGRFTLTGEFPERVLGVIRLLENGQLDPSFNPVPALSALEGFPVQKIALQADGRILIQGGFTRVGGFPRPGVARLWPNGTVDPDFAPGSPRLGQLAGNVAALAVSPNNAVFLGGDFHQFDGVPRTNFVRINGGPLQPIPAPPTIANQPTRVVATAGTDVTFTVEAGGTGPFQYQWRRNATRGSTNFADIPGATNATLTLPAVDYWPNTDSGLFEVRVVNPGGMVASRLITLLVEPDPVVPGTPDQSFAPTAPIGVLTGQPQVTEIAPGGQLYASLNSTVVRLHEDGTQDITFNAPADLTPLANGGVSAVKRQPDGKVLVAGRLNGSGLVRLMPDGSYDPGFVRTNNFTGFAQNVPWEIGLQSDGKILLGGTFENFAGRTVNGLIRFHPDGRVDDTFPLTTLQLTLSNPTRVLPGSVVALKVLSDDRIYIAGGFTHVQGVSRVGVARLLPNGAVDPAFVPPTNGSTSTGLGGTMLFYSLGPVTPDEGVYLFGTFTTEAGQAPDSAVRLLPNGAVDPTFHVKTDFQINFGAVQADGKMIITGQFTRLNGQLRAGFARLNVDGSTDASFTQGAAFGVGSPMSILPDGKLLIGGTRYFTGEIPVAPTAQIGFEVGETGLVLNWPVGYQLQKTTQLVPANWQPVVATPPLTVPLGGPGEFYRLVPAP